MFHRSERVAALIKEEIARMIIMGELKDPRLQHTTILEVDVSKDLSKATIYVRSESSAERETVINGFKRASGFIKKTLSKKFYIKRMPNLFFVYDSSLESINRIEEILKNIND